jgi:hypothetical protein
MRATLCLEQGLQPRGAFGSSRAREALAGCAVPIRETRVIRGCFQKSGYRKGRSGLRISRMELDRVTAKYSGIDPELRRLSRAGAFGVDGYVGNTPLIGLRRLSSCPVITCNSSAMPECGRRHRKIDNKTATTPGSASTAVDFSPAIRPEGDAVTMKRYARKRFHSHSGAASTPLECLAA